jgi:surfeit locus 1 family protein
MTDRRSAISPSGSRSQLTLGIWVVSLLVLTAAFIALGVWQVKRLHWKLDLIARVEARVHAPAIRAPGPEEWPSINAADDEYLHIQAAGVLLNDDEAEVYAVTDLGPGYWVMTPLKAADGTIILINRGFVPTNRRNRATRIDGNPTGKVAVTGLLRLNEPLGTLLRSNVPADERWYSRDVAAIARSRSLTNVAPYFIDADAAPNRGGLPVGGLTQLVFPNSHLAYAITWFVMAAMSLGMTIYLILIERLRVQSPAEGN